MDLINNPEEFFEEYGGAALQSFVEKYAPMGLGELASLPAVRSIIEEIGPDVVEFVAGLNFGPAISLDGQLAEITLSTTMQTPYHQPSLNLDFEFGVPSMPTAGFSIDFISGQTSRTIGWNLPGADFTVSLDNNNTMTSVSVLGALNPFTNVGGVMTSNPNQFSDFIASSGLNYRMETEFWAHRQYQHSIEGSRGYRNMEMLENQRTWLEAQKQVLEYADTYNLDLPDNYDDLSIDQLNVEIAAISTVKAFDALIDLGVEFGSSVWDAITKPVIIPDREHTFRAKLPNDGELDLILGPADYAMGLPDDGGTGAVITDSYKQQKIAAITDGAVIERTSYIADDDDSGGGSGSGGGSPGNPTGGGSINRSSYNLNERHSSSHHKNADDPDSRYDREDRDRSYSDRGQQAGNSTSGNNSGHGSGSSETRYTSGDNESGSSGDDGKPILLDLNGDGSIDLTGLADSHARFDIDSDGFDEKLTWIGTDDDTSQVEDGFLVVDDNLDGDITADELALAQQTTDPTDTDLEVFAAIYDSNADGVVDNQDAEWSKIRVWKDSDADGAVDEGELLTPDAARLTAINVDSSNGAWVPIDDLTDIDLAPFGVTREDIGVVESPGIDQRRAAFLSEGAVLYGTTKATIDGEQHLAADVGLLLDKDGVSVTKDANGNTEIQVEGGGLTYTIADPAGSVVDLADEGYVAVYGGAGDDTLSVGHDDGGILSGGSGADELTGGAGSDTLVGNSGADTLQAGAGDDTLFIDADDVLQGIVQGGDGVDTAFVESDVAFSLTLGTHGLEAVFADDTDDILAAGSAQNVVLQGNGGADTLTGGAGSDTLQGGSGNDHLDGQDGDDSLSGASGNDDLTGGAGADTLSGGYGNDTLDGGAGDDVLYLGSGDDTLTGGPGADRFVYFSGNGTDEITDFSPGEDLLELSSAGFDDFTTTSDTYVDPDTGETVTDTLVIVGEDTIRLRGADPALVPAAIAYALHEGTENADTLTGDAIDNVIDAKAGDDSIMAGEGGDLVVAGAGDDTVDGGAGDDQLDGGTGNDTLIGGAGNDRLDGGAGADDLSGGPDGDMLVGGAGNDTLAGGSHDDVLFGGVEHDTLNGDAGNDTLIGNTGNDTLNGGDGEDVLSGGRGNDSLTGGAGDDVLSGDLGNDTLVGGEGSDTFAVSAGDGADVITDFATGIDTIELWYVDPANTTVIQDGADALIDTGEGTLRILGAAPQVSMVDAAIRYVHQSAGSGGGTLNGHDGANVFVGGDAADELIGGAGDDRLFGGAGNDTLKGGDGDDELDGAAGTDELTGGAGEDLFVIREGDGESKITDFEPGTDKLVFRGLSRDQVTITDEGTDTRFAISGASFLLEGKEPTEVADGDLVFIQTDSDNFDETLIGSMAADALSGGYGDDRLYGDVGDDALSGDDGNDLISGDAGDDTLSGGAGDDAVTGGRGADVIDGGAGNDALTGNRGDDVLAGGEGADVFSFAQGDGLDTITDFSVAEDKLVVSFDNPADVTVTESGDNTVVGYGDDQVTLSGISDPNLLTDDNIIVNWLGSDSADTKTGSVWQDVMTGLAGNDHLSGGDGDDTLNGNDGNDTLFGGNGDDALVGGRGNDQLTGGAGADTFYVADGGADTITDFDPTTDTIDFGAYGRGDLVLEATGTPSFAPAIIAYDGAYTINDGGWSSFDAYPRFVADVNGDGRADIVGMHQSAVVVSLGQTDGTFGAPFASVDLGSAFTAGGGWLSNQTYPIRVGDVNGDGRADIVGFADQHVHVALGRADGTFASAEIALHDRFSTTQGWTSQDTHLRQVADINGDGRADIVGFGLDEVTAALGQADGTFGSAFTVHDGAFTKNDGNWYSDALAPRHLADVNGDGRADIVGFAGGAVVTALAQVDQNGTPSFTTDYHVLEGDFGLFDGWSSSDSHPRLLADINGDGRADIVGFADTEVRAALGQADGSFASPFVVMDGNFTIQDGNWHSQDLAPRLVADVDGDGRADIVGFSGDNVQTALSTGTNIGTRITYGDHSVLVDGINPVQIPEGALRVYHVPTGYEGDVAYGGPGADIVWGREGGDFIDGGAGDDILSGDVNLREAVDGAMILISASVEVPAGADAPRLRVVIDGEVYDGAQVTEVYGVDEPGTYAYRIEGVFQYRSLEIGFADGAAEGSHLLIHDVRVEGKPVGLDRQTTLLPPAWVDHGLNDVMVRLAPGTRELRFDVSTIGAVRDDVLLGGQGNDTLDGQRGDDQLTGGTGDDTLTGGEGADVFVFGEGEGTDTITDFDVEEDTLVLQVADPAAVTVSVVDGNTVVDHGGGQVTLAGVQAANLLADGDVVVRWDGGSQTDTQAGTIARDVLSGQDGDDTLTGAAGDDSLFGDAGNDTLTGGDGDDALIGGAGDDTLTGGAGADVFVVGDGGADVITDFDPSADWLSFGEDGRVLSVEATGAPSFAPAIVAYDGAYTLFDGGWSSVDAYPRFVADVDGDGRADIVGMHQSAVVVSLGRTDGTFGTPITSTELGLAFTAGGGWLSNDTYPCRVGDVNGDGRADIVGFAHTDVYVALGRADGTFASADIALGGRFTTTQGWTSDDSHLRQVADINGDGRADIVGFGDTVVKAALGQADGSFGPEFTVYASDFTTTMGNWYANALAPRFLADVNGDGAADIVGFAGEHVRVALAQIDGSGTPGFGASFVAFDGDFSLFDGWSSTDSHPRTLADINGDGRADIVGFAGDAVRAALGQADGSFGSPIVVHDGNFTIEDGNWYSQDLAPRHVADVDGDGRADIVGFAGENVQTALSNASGPGTLITHDGGTVQLDGVAPVAALASPGLVVTQTGTDAPDTLDGGPGRDALDGLAGDDTLTGGPGDDILFGGAGDDTLDGGPGADVFDVSGGGGNQIVDFDPTKDVIDFGDLGRGDLTVAATGTPGFGSAITACDGAYTINDGGWLSVERYPRFVADVDGDGRADIVGVHQSAVVVSRGQADGTFGAPITSTALGTGFTEAAGWTGQETYPRRVADINGDGRADLVGFAQSQVVAALGQEDGTFGSAYVAHELSFTVDGGWTADTATPRHLGDINGDGRADIVGFGGGNVWVALAQADGTFATATVAHTPSFTITGGWTDDNATPRLVGDVNGDGRADVVGFGGSNVWVSLGQADGTVGSPFVAHTPSFTISGGWTSDDSTPRTLADINGDGRADIIGFGGQQVWAALGQADGTFTSPFVVLDGNFTIEDGNWYSQNLAPRHVADVDGDGRADIVGFSGDEVQVALSRPELTGSVITYGGDHVLLPGVPVVAVPESALRVFQVPTGYGNDIATGGDGSDWIQGQEGADWIDGGDGDDIIHGDLDVATEDDGALILIWASGSVPAGHSLPQMRVEIDGEVYPDVEVTSVTGTDEPGLYGFRVTGSFDLSTLQISQVATATAKRLFIHDIVWEGAPIGIDLFTGTPPTEAELQGVDDAMLLLSPDGSAATFDLSTIDGVRNDTLQGGAGDDTLHGGQGDDVLSGGAGQDSLMGETGDDQLFGEADTDWINGGHGADAIDGGGGADYLWGGDGNDQIVGGSDDDTIWGQNGNDTLHGGDGQDSLMGENGNDHIFGGTETDWINGGAGTDTLVGDDGADYIWGGADGDEIAGGAGNDTIWADDGNDRLVGGVGDDTMEGGAGPDSFVFHAGDGADTITDFAGGPGAGDWLDFASQAIGFANLEVVQSGADTVITNTASGDSVTLVGVTASNLAEDDFALSVSNGALKVYQLVNGTAGNDTIDGGATPDTVFAGSGDDFVHGHDGGDILRGEAGQDTLMGDAGNDFIYGGTETDWINGGTGTDTLVGGEGADYIWGGSDGDEIAGGNGNDTIWAEHGNDRLVGGAGNDTLEGGAGPDSFVFHAGDGADTITDFVSGEDFIDFRGHAAFNAFADVQAAMSQSGTDTLIDAGGSDQIVLQDVLTTDLTAGDFLFV